MPSFQGFDGSFFAENDGGPVNSQVSASAGTIAMNWNDRSVFVANATVYASQTITMPKKVEVGDFVRISAQNTVTALTIQDGFGTAITGAPNAIDGGQQIVLRYLGSSIGWVVWAVSTPTRNVQYLEMTNTTNAPIISATFLQAPKMVLNMIGTLASGQTLTLPSAPNFIPHMPRGLFIGATFELRVINSGAGAFSWTVTTNSGWTVSGDTLTVAQNTWRDFIVTVNTLTTAVLKPAGIGTFS